MGKAAYMYNKLINAAKGKERKLEEQKVKGEAQHMTIRDTLANSRSP